MNIASRLFCFTILVLLACGVDAFAQIAPDKRPPLVIKRPEITAKLVDEFGKLTSEDRSSRFDTFFQELSQNPGSTGYVFLYCGRKCRYDEIVDHIRGIEVKIALREFDRSRLVIQDAGFHESFRTQLWLVGPGACLPVPQSSVHIKNVEFTKPNTFLMEAYDCCDDYSDVWKNLKTKP